MGGETTSNTWIPSSETGRSRPSRPGGNGCSGPREPPPPATVGSRRSDQALAIGEVPVQRRARHAGRSGDVGAGVVGDWSSRRRLASTMRARVLRVSARRSGPRADPRDVRCRSGIRRPVSQITGQLGTERPVARPSQLARGRVRRSARESRSGRDTMCLERSAADVNQNPRCGAWFAPPHRGSRPECRRSIEVTPYLKSLLKDDDVKKNLRRAGCALRPGQGPGRQAPQPPRRRQGPRGLAPRARGRGLLARRPDRA